MGANIWHQDLKPPQELSGVNWKTQFCLPNVPNCGDNLVSLFSGGTGDTYSTWGAQADNGSDNNIYAYNDDFTWVKGNHTIKFGGIYQETIYNGFGRQCEARLRGVQLSGNRRAGRLQSECRRQCLCFVPAGSRRQRTDRYPPLHWPEFQIFCRLRPGRLARQSKLVLNLGFRYDVNTPPVGTNSEWANFSPTTPNPAANNIPGAVVFAGTGPGRTGSQRPCRRMALGLRTAPWVRLLLRPEDRIPRVVFAVVRCAAIRQRFHPQRRHSL